MKISNILYPVELTEISSSIAPHVAFHAEKHNAKIHLLHVAPNVQVTADIYNLSPGRWVEQETLTNTARHLLTDFRNNYLPEAEETISVGDAVEDILEYIKKNGIDMVIMGTHGRKGLGRVALGSVATRIVRRSPVPVLTINPYLQEEAEGK